MEKTREKFRLLSIYIVIEVVVFDSYIYQFSILQIFLLNFEMAHPHYLFYVTTAVIHY